MLNIVIFFSLLVASWAMPVDEANNCGFPNGTDKALHYYMCSESELDFLNDFGIIPFPKTDKIQYMVQRIW